VKYTPGVSSSLTIAALLADPSLSTELISGSTGVERTVLWAHSCEMENPARWLQPHELLMTIGHCVPAGSEQQRRFIASLDEAGLAGLTIGHHNIAPRLTKAFFEESEARGFPVMKTSPQVPFAAISRLVASSNSEKLTIGVLRLAKLYQSTAERDMEQKRSGAPLAELFGTPLTVIDDETGCVVIGDGVIFDADGPTREIALSRTVRPATLILRRRAPLDGFTLGHLSQVLEVDANEILLEAVNRMNVGKTDFATALLSRGDAVRVMDKHWGSEKLAYRLVAGSKNNGRQLPLALALAEIPALTYRGDEANFIVAPEQYMDRLQAILSELDIHAGVSMAHSNPGDLGGALQEAVSELAVAISLGQHWREYEGGRVSLLARSATERSRIITAVLGPLASEEPGMTALRETLFAFLDNNQGWKETAAQLKMHRQSIVYRLNRVEEVTGRSVHRTGDIAEFWLARTCWEQYLSDTQD